MRRINISFILLVVAPTIATIAYYSTLSSDIYVSESKFVVRSAQKGMSNPIENLIRSGSLTRAQDESFTIQEFLNSRQALQEPGSRLEFRQAMSDSRIDRLSRFPPPLSDNSDEALYRFYRKMVTATYDSSTAVTTLSVRSFNPVYAQKLNEWLLKESEELTNHLNDRARNDLVASAQRDVATALGLVKTTSIALASYRTSKNIIDPERQANIQLQQLTRLFEDQFALQLQIDQLKALSPDNPQLSTLRSKYKSITQAIDSENAKITGSTNSLTSKSGDFQRLQLEKELAEKQLASSLGSLETARAEARRQQVYLERVAEPQLPDSAIEPRRYRNTIAIFITATLLWGVGTLLVAGIREHHD